MKYYLFYKNSDYGYYSKLVKNFLKAAFSSTMLFLLIASIFFLIKINRTTTQYNQAILKNTQVEIQKTVENAENLTRQISMNQQVIQYLSPIRKTDYIEINDINLLLMNFVSNNSYIDSVYVVYPDRNMVITSYGLYSLDYFPDKAWLADDSKQTQKNKIVWYGKRSVKRNRFTNANTNVITISINIVKNGSSGYVIMNINEKYIADILVHMQTKKGILFVQGEDGALISCSQDITQYTFAKNFFTRINNRNRPYLNLIHIENSTNIINEVISEYNGWNYIACTPINTLITEYSSFFSFYIFFIIIVIIISYLFALHFGKNTYQPIRNFINTILDAENAAITDEYPEFKRCSANISSIKKEKDELSKQISLMRPSLTEKLFHELLNGHFGDEKKYSEYWDFLHIPYRQYKNYTVASLFIHEYDRQKNVLSHEKIIIYRLSIQNFMNEICKDKHIFIQFVEQDFKTFSFVLGFSEYTNNTDMEHIMNATMDFVSRNFGIPITVGVGSPVEELISLFISYNQSMEALNQNILYGSNDVIYFDNIDHEFIGCYINPLIYEKQLTSAIRNFNSEDVSQILRDIQSLITMNRYDIRLTRHFYLSVLNMVFFIEQDIFEQPEAINVQLNVLTGEIYQEQSMNGIHEIVKDACLNICKRVEQQTFENRKQTIHAIVHYLETNYRSDIGLNDVAEYISYTPTYINRILKDSLHKTFYDILTDIRINKAKELLLHTDLQIYQIAEMIGYTNVQSFIRVFKKVLTVTPGKYREGKSGETDYFYKNCT